MIPDHRETQHDTAKTTLQFVAYRLVTSSHNVWFTLLTASGYHTHYVDLYVKNRLLASKSAVCWCSFLHIVFRINNETCVSNGEISFEEDLNTGPSTLFQFPF